MKRIIAALLVVLCFASASSAAFSKKGYIPEGDPIKYSGLKVTENGVNIVLHNTGDKAVVFNAAVTFIGSRRKELGDFYIEKTAIEPGGEVVFRNLYLKGDHKLCRSAESLRWTIYLLETR